MSATLRVGSVWVAHFPSLGSAFHDLFDFVDAPTAAPLKDGAEPKIMMVLQMVTAAEPLNVERVVVVDVMWIDFFRPADRARPNRQKALSDCPLGRNAGGALFQFSRRIADGLQMPALARIAPAGRFGHLVVQTTSGAFSDRHVPPPSSWRQFLTEIRSRQQNNFRRKYRKSSKAITLIFVSGTS